MTLQLVLRSILVAMVLKTITNICSVDAGKGIFYTITNIDLLEEARNNVSDRLCRMLVRHQQPVCLTHPDLIPSVVRGINLAVQECQLQFANNHWNCLGHNITTSNSRQKRRQKNTVLDNLINRGTTESGYLNAIISAGVSHQVTLACSRGHHRHCGCDKTIYDVPLEGNFQWSGCSENIHFGAAFSKRFLDTPHKRRLKRNPVLGLVNLHNSHLGRKVVIDNMGTKCKCHGVSGSCDLRTCYKALPSLRVVGDLLKQRFSLSVFVEMKNLKLISKHRVNQVVFEDDLTYAKESPNFCERDHNHGSLGTSGRICNNTLNENGSENEANCETLCCGRGFRTTRYMKKENCRCKFIWCCKVVCETCEVEAVETVCN